LQRIAGEGLVEDAGFSKLAPHPLAALNGGHDLVNHLCTLGSSDLRFLLAAADVFSVSSVVGHSCIPCNNAF
jgi:hypothetical protein